MLKRPYRDMASSVKADVPSTVAPWFPTPEPEATREVLEETFTFATKLLEANKAFALGLLEVSEPVRVQVGEEVRLEPWMSPRRSGEDQLQRLGDSPRRSESSTSSRSVDLARLADLSDTYMSQLERGMHEPSIRVLRSVAEGLGIRPDQLIMYAAGLPVEEGEVSTEAAIKRDERLTPAQRQALLGVLRSYIEGNQAG